MKKITPHLWFDKEAKEAARFYASVFPKSKVRSVSTIHDTPSGDCDIVSFEIAGQLFAAISAGPYFKFNPSVSFMVNFDPSQDKNARKNLDAAWKKLSIGGTALMPLDKYFFSERYGWIQDKFGLSWQLILTDPKGKKRPFIVPSLMFAGNVSGKAEKAINFYLSIFKKGSKAGAMHRYGKGQEGREGTVMFADFNLAGQWMAAMDNPRKQNFAFNEAVSFVVSCKTQKEIDYYWSKLSAVPEAEQCGWLKDKFGLSWQIVPADMGKLMGSKDPKKTERVTQAFLKMKKFNIAQLKKAYAGK